MTRRKPCGHQLKALFNTLVKHLFSQLGRRLQPTHLHGHNDEHRRCHGAHEHRDDPTFHAAKDGVTCSDFGTSGGPGRIDVNKDSQPVHAFLTKSSSELVQRHKVNRRRGERTRAHTGSAKRGLCSKRHLERGAVFLSMCLDWHDKWTTQTFRIFGIFVDRLRSEPSDDSSRHSRPNHECRRH